MENRTSFAGTFLLIGFAAFISLPLQPSFSDPAGSNCWHLNSPLQAESNADLVCKVSEMARLLDDSNTYARFVAVGALMNYTGQGPEHRGWEEFKKDDRQYIEYWKDWWQQNKDNFAPLQAP